MSKLHATRVNLNHWNTISHDRDYELMLSALANWGDCAERRRTLAVIGMTAADDVAGAGLMPEASPRCVAHTPEDQFIARRQPVAYIGDDCADYRFMFYLVHDQSEARIARRHTQMAAGGLDGEDFAEFARM